MGAALVLLALGVTGCTAVTGGGEAADPDDPAAFVLDEDFPDPDVLADGNGFAAFATGTHGLNIRVARSTDLMSWTVERRDALPLLPVWASTGQTWAPEVTAAGDEYLMYFNAPHRDSERQCIGVASAATLDEAFVSTSDEPLVCPAAEGGAIDASVFDDDDGTRYLLWKIDGNRDDLDTWLVMAPLSADGRALAGEPVQLLKQTLEWEGSVIEAPVLVFRDGAYRLLYSANDYGDDSYAIGVASSDEVSGPYEKHLEPLLSTNGSGGAFLGPGGQDVVATADGDVLVFHGWDEQFIYRGMHARSITWGDAPAVGLED